VLALFYFVGGVYMILSIGLILVVGFIVGALLSKIKIPGLVGMIILGLIIGPYCLGLIDDKVLAISTELRQIALVIILTRSGLNLDLDSLKKIGRPAVLMAFVPATCEIIAVAIIKMIMCFNSFLIKDSVVISFYHLFLLFL
jgi:NhaP-type Na+/H+ or K+/H+ antiporter